MHDRDENDEKGRLRLIIVEVEKPAEGLPVWMTPEELEKASRPRTNNKLN